MYRFLVLSILLEYKDIDKITKAVKAPQAEIVEDDEDG